MHLAVAISSHGFGHGAQTTAVLAALRKILPDLHLTLLTGLPRAFLQERIGGDFDLIDWRGDFGMRMVSALEVDLTASAADYAALHADWPAQVQDTARLLERIKPDLLLANIPYLALAAAATAGIPSLALCSLNWASIYQHYFMDRPEAHIVFDAMVEAYNSARYFLCPTPSMTMPELDNVRNIGPLAGLGRDCRADLCAQLGIPESRRLIMIAPGGIPVQFPLEDWPIDPELVWIVPHAWDVVRDDMRPFEGLGLSFVDVLATVDAVLGKLGYGTVAECACNGTPMLYIPRPDWPEEPYLAAWLERHGRCAPVTRAAIATGHLRGTLESLWAQPVPLPPRPSGAEEAATLIADSIQSG